MLLAIWLMLYAGLIICNMVSFELNISFTQMLPKLFFAVWCVMLLSKYIIFRTFNLRICLGAFKLYVGVIWFGSEPYMLNGEWTLNHDINKQCFKYRILMIYQSTKLYTGYRIPDDISRYGTKYRTSNQTSYGTKNIHVIAYINHMKLFKASLRW